MKKWIACVLALVCVFGLAGCGTKSVEERFCDSLEQAEKIIGFRLDAPESLNNSGTKTFRVNGRTLEIMYFDGKVISGKISKSDNKDNIEGYDYGYTESAIISHDGIEYSLFGNQENEMVYLATWVNDKYSYLVLYSSGKIADEMVELCKRIH